MLSKSNLIMDIDYGNETVISCSFNADTLSGTIECRVKNTLIFKWTNLGRENFEEIHGLSRILILLPDKWATAIKINNKFYKPPHSGSLLVKLVKDLCSFYDKENKRRKIPSFSDTLRQLVRDCEFFMDCLDFWRPDLELIVLAQEFLIKCELLQAGVFVYLNYLHAQLQNIERSNTRIPLRLLFDLTAHKVVSDRHKLSNEFSQVLDSGFP